MEKKKIRDQVQRQIEISIKKRDGKAAIERQSMEQITSLERKISAARRKLEQARSERAALTRYRMEVLAAQMDRWNAHTQQQLIVNELKWLAHGYPAP